MVDEFSALRPHAPPPSGVGRSGALVGETVHLYRDLKAGVEVESDVAPALGRSGSTASRSSAP